MTAAVATAQPRSTAARRRQASVLDYVPLTGEPPENLQRGETFVHTNVRFTPSMAALCIAVNAPYNRGVSWTNVDEWAQEMLDGEWNDPVPQGVAFSNEGHLIDGQTRCYALVKAGKTNPDLVLTMPAWHNWDPKIYEKLDRVRRRNSTHALQSIGFVSATNIGAIITMLTKYRAMYAEDPITHENWRKIKLSPTFIKSFAKRERTELETCFGLSQPMYAKGGANRTAAATTIYLLREAASITSLTDLAAIKLRTEVVQHFIHGVSNPVAAMCRTDDPRNAAHQAFRKPHRERHEYLGLLLRAWEYWARGKAASGLVWTEGKSTMPDVYVPREQDWAGIQAKWVRS